MLGLDTGSLDRRVRIEQPVADAAFDGAGSGEWESIATVWASIVDALPSRGERLAEGINVSTRPARVRMRYRADVTAAMRLVEILGGADGRVMQIVTVPAELGRRDGLEMMVETYEPGGNTA
ncbi:head-tail adaptor protein [Sphingomonas sp. RRHST34]|uniref:Head-tail adaptor protein n=1 Tax=Sphingomonas citri TaxID=2862499 RepID=A0ABS7BQR0_9SPHN|nr:head-tail adaptor protein [Sphingomonas citri]MBW6531923.1 head-tail adaptor protein [Sphingomonas citri]